MSMEQENDIGLQTESTRNLQTVGSGTNVGLVVTHDAETQSTYSTPSIAKELHPNYIFIYT